MKNKQPYVLSFNVVDQQALPLVGGKGANLAALARMEGIRVPEGFCVTTAAYQEIVAGHRALPSLLEQLAELKADDTKNINKISAEIRYAIEHILIPDAIATTIVSALKEHGVQKAYAVRSSATAEDLSTASFAGQQDSYLNIIGADAILKHISKCWASLFTERAVIYRIQNGFDHRNVYLSVVVQQMIFSRVSGILFTADPVTANRKISSIDAGFGLGEALVGGLVNADIYKVREGIITDKRISEKKIAVFGLKEGGTGETVIADEMQRQQALTNEQILELDKIGRKIEVYFGAPQDMEWCLADGNFYIVQSRPITTLFPVPDVADMEKHVYVSVGHQQMMTDAMKPLGLSFYDLNAGRAMFTAGGRLFVDVAKELSSAAGRNMMVNVLGKSDPLIKGAFETIIERDFIPLLPDEKESATPGGNATPSLKDFQALSDYDASVVTELIERAEASLAKLKVNIKTVSGGELFDFIKQDIQQSRAQLHDPRSFGVIMTGMNASHWLNEKIEEWLGEKNVADTISQSVDHNLTSEMGLALMDVADVIRPYPEIINYLQQSKDDGFLLQLKQFNGGENVYEAFQAFLDKYGMRCAGEIDITRPRWSEQPIALVPAIRNNVRMFEAGAGVRRFEQGRTDAKKREQEILARLRQLPDGEQKATETKRMIDLVRNLSGYREYPKYAIVSRYAVYKQALLNEALKLTQAGIIREPEDIFYLRFDEVAETVRAQQLDYQIIDLRKDEYEAFTKLKPPRVMTSEGEVISSAYKRENLPEKALVGLAVSAGLVEGRARVILKMEDAVLEEGDILVTSFTDPSWTPVFVSIKGLVTEVGGLMTHGAVIAREYGLPAVVGVENATKLIRDGQRIRVHGTDGWIELL
ncbi:phosphoenolpyruvate synthase [Taibaiella soli]|uniref:Prodigiosin synthesizing transferase PigC n=1 Tax=Taibaiella soli TaxID=1649169 RepID=A0A2W2AE98_9BACT|nr:phosphoenolpyruvate synthase [Taibaiella soli]PZF71892.1 phosphoenolpyruvate synthase [Taibaiella soli]